VQVSAGAFRLAGLIITRIFKVFLLPTITALLFIELEGYMSTIITVDRFTIFGFKILIYKRPTRIKP